MEYPHVPNKWRQGEKVPNSFNNGDEKTVNLSTCRQSKLQREYIKKNPYCVALYNTLYVISIVKLIQMSEIFDS